MNELRIQHVAFAGDSMEVHFTGGSNVSVPVSSFPRLQSATAAQRDEWELIGRGLGVHWESVDEDLSIENILLAYSRTDERLSARVAES